MAITCNFDKNNHENRKDDKLIVRIPPGQNIGADTTSQNSAKRCAYLWDLSPRPRSGKSWRNVSSIN